MKSMVKILIVVLSFITFTNLFSQEYSQPKSIVYDAPRERYLISNKLSGQILALNSSNELSVFIDAQLTEPRGMIIINDSLYVADLGNLVCFDLNTGNPNYTYTVEGATKIVDIANDSDNYIFMTDITQRKIFVYNISDKSILSYALQQIEKPECIIYYDNKLYMTNYWEEAQIIVFDLTSWSEETRYDFSNYKYFDGITKDNDGNLYIACWGDMMVSEGIGKILKCSMNDINNLTEFRSGFSAPSDIYFNSVKNELAIPNYTGNSVDFIPLVENVYDNQNENSLFIIEQNRLNNSIKIRFKKNLTSNENLYLYNIFGQLLIKDQLSLNQNEYNLNLNGLNQGIYFIKIGNNSGKILISN